MAGRTRAVLGVKTPAEDGGGTVVNGSAGGNSLLPSHVHRGTPRKTDLMSSGLGRPSVREHPFGSLGSPPLYARAEPHKIVQGAAAAVTETAEAGGTAAGMVVVVGNDAAAAGILVAKRKSHLKFLLGAAAPDDMFLDWREFLWCPLEDGTHLPLGYHNTLDRWYYPCLCSCGTVLQKFQSD